MTSLLKNVLYGWLLTSSPLLFASAQSRKQLFYVVILSTTRGGYIPTYHWTGSNKNLNEINITLIQVTDRDEINNEWSEIL